MRATFAASIRLICPAPMASVRSADVKIIVFDLTCAQTRHANRSASPLGGRRLPPGHDTKVARRPRLRPFHDAIARLDEHDAEHRAQLASGVACQAP